jgi:hypothetical protein
MAATRLTADGGWDSPAGSTMADSSFTSADFHSVVHKQIVQAVYETLADGKIAWDLILPFLDTAREICRSDFEEASRIRLHSVRAEGDDWVDAEEAYLGIAVADRDTGEDWLSETYWLSDVALADDDAEQVRRTVAALERSLAKIKAWLAEQEKGGPDDSEPPSLPADS